MYFSTLAARLMQPLGLPAQLAARDELHDRVVGVLLHMAANVQAQPAQAVGQRLDDGGAGRGDGCQASPR
jgi:hypothetical protein